MYTTFVNSLTNEKPADKFDAADKSKMDRQTKPSNGSMPLRKVWKGGYRKKQKEFRGHCKVGILFSLFFTYLYGAAGGAPGGAEGFPRAGGFRFPDGIPGGLHGLEEGSNL